MRVIFDCTELHRNPVRTGIQRVVRELLRHWPADAGRFEVARFQAGSGLVSIDETSLNLLLDQDEAQRLSEAALRTALQRRMADSRVLNLEPDALVFIPEVFYDPERAAFHRRRLQANPASLAMLGYDFLPWLQPSLFRIRSTVPLMPYFRLIRDASHVAFISENTRREYAQRICRQPAAIAGPVLPLGADGLRLERQHWSPERREFVTIGSIDGRKNQDRIVAAFLRLWERGEQARLTLVGGVFDSVDHSWIETAVSHPSFCWMQGADDAAVADLLRRARATIYMSEAEGFGLPPVESLHAGIPVIVSAGIPSVAMNAGHGQIRLQAPDPELIAAAVALLLDDDEARRLWEETAELRLHTWSDFGHAAASWIKSLSQ